MDESGTPAKPSGVGSKYFVVGGLIVPEAKWHGLRDGYSLLTWWQGQSGGNLSEATRLGSTPLSRRYVEVPPAQQMVNSRDPRRYRC